MADRTYSVDEAKRDAKAVANETAGELREGARRIAEDARETLDNVTRTDSVERVKERGAELADAARDAGREYADRARHEAERLYDEGRRRAQDVATYAEEGYDELSDMVRRKPAQALGIAAGVGFLIGLVLASRR